jgi:hypothetical protein
MALFDVNLQASDADLPTLIDLLRSTPFRIVSMTRSTKPSPANKPGRRFRHGVRVKEIGGRDLVLKTLTERGRCSPSTITDQFLAHGFAASSAATMLQKLRSEGLVGRTRDGFWFKSDPKLNGNGSVHETTLRRSN